MASLIPGFEYDIFISYRHNDNKSGWVTEFVAQLEEELASTIKEPLTIYFDKNPHDGLLETHNVDKSLEGKLKCLIFIPIISQTYCDPKSFAWQHEFCVFNKLANEDHFDRDIKLGNGNVASRILPIRIHELDQDDRSMIEKEIGGPLRAIEFIYKSEGVNRPLNSKDDVVRAIGQILYRDQVNKTANAVKEIIKALKGPNQAIDTKTDQTIARLGTQNSLKRIIIASILLLCAVLIAGYFLAKKNGNTNAHTIKRSIAVLPFVDLSESKDQEWFADGLTEEILNSLTHVDSLQVISRTSSFAFKNRNLPVQQIGDSLSANYIVEGSVRKSSSGLRITAQLIRAKDGSHIWSNTYDRNSKDIFEIQSDIASKVAIALDISLDPVSIKSMYWSGTKNAEAYLAFRKGVDLSNRAHFDFDYVDVMLLVRANKFFEEAIYLDSGFVSPYLFHSDLYHHTLLNDGYYPGDTTSAPYAHRMLLLDLDNAIRWSKDGSQKKYYSISRTMFSDNWSDLGKLVNEVLDDPGFEQRIKYQLIDITYLIICVGEGDKMARCATKILETEPGNRFAIGQLIQNAMHRDRLDEVMEINKNTGGSNRIALLAMYRLGMFNEITDILQKIDPKTKTAYIDIQSLMLAHAGRTEEAKVLMRKQHKFRSTYMFALDEIFGRAEANRFAALVDEKPVQHYLLLWSLALSPGDLPFDLSATPNFARRLKQAGVIITLNDAKK